jgi:homoserine O-acetyltransferase
VNRDPRSVRGSLLLVRGFGPRINSPDLGILEREIKRVPRGRAIVIPFSDKTRGHGSHTLAALWEDQLADLLKETEK